MVGVPSLLTQLLCFFGTSNTVASADQAPTDAAQLVHQREQHFATVQEHYYRNPPRIERGWQHTLVDVDARCYLDMVNNCLLYTSPSPRDRS